jgi:hypothetical protein
MGAMEHGYEKPRRVQMHGEHELYQPDVCEKYQLNRDDQDAVILRGICSGGISLTSILIFPISRGRSSTPLAQRENSATNEG